MVFALPHAPAALAILAFCQNGMPHVLAAFLIPSGLFGAYYFRREAGKTAHRLNETRCSLTTSANVRATDENHRKNPKNTRSLLARLRPRSVKLK